VSTLPHQISLLLDPDERLVAAVGGAARYFADAAGLGNETILQFHCHSSGIPCGITLRRSLDRLEVEVALPGTEPPSSEKPSWEGIDEVECESRDHSAILRLTKFVAPNPPAD